MRERKRERKGERKRKTDRKKERESKREREREGYKQTAIVRNANYSRGVLPYLFLPSQLWFTKTTGFAASKQV